LPAIDHRWNHADAWIEVSRVLRQDTVSGDNLGTAPDYFVVLATMFPTVEPWVIQMSHFVVSGVNGIVETEDYFLMPPQYPVFYVRREEWKSFAVNHDEVKFRKIKKLEQPLHSTVKRPRNLGPNFSVELKCAEQFRGAERGNRAFIPCTLQVWQELVHPITARRILDRVRG